MPVATSGKNACRYLIFMHPRGDHPEEIFDGLLIARDPSAKHLQPCGQASRPVRYLRQEKRAQAYRPML